MTWQINPEDLKAIELLDLKGFQSLTDLVREIYGIELGEDGKDDNKDRLKKINRFKKHLSIMVEEGFIEKSTAKTESSNHPITVYSISKEIIRGKGILLVFAESGLDVTEVGRILKGTKPDGTAMILPLSITT
jgi:hypothetical protein